MHTLDVDYEYEGLALRGYFAIGEGPWADFGTVANEIQIKFHVLANGK